jgi:hypothetical protein
MAVETDHLQPVGRVAVTVHFSDQRVVSNSEGVDRDAVLRNIGFNQQEILRRMTIHAASVFVCKPHRLQALNAERVLKADPRQTLCGTKECHAQLGTGFADEACRALCVDDEQLLADAISNAICGYRESAQLCANCERQAVYGLL